MLDQAFDRVVLRRLFVVEFLCGSVETPGLGLIQAAQQHVMHITPKTRIPTTNQIAIWNST